MSNCCFYTRQWYWKRINFFFHDLYGFLTYMYCTPHVVNNGNIACIHIMYLIRKQLCIIMTRSDSLCTCQHVTNLKFSNSLTNKFSRYCALISKPTHQSGTHPSDVQLETLTSQDIFEFVYCVVIWDKYKSPTQLCAVKNISNGVRGNRWEPLTPC